MAFVERPWRSSVIVHSLRATTDMRHSLLSYPVSREIDEEANAITKLAFEFLILTAARTSEVLQARWAEIDVGEKLWIVPASRMKAAREHRVPLSTRGMEIVEAVRPFSAGSPFMFPGRSLDKPMSNMVFLKVLERMKATATAHGFRSSFRDWAAETTNHPRELAEMALAHTIANKVEAAYRRGDLLEKRRQLMEDWARFVVWAKGTTGGNDGQDSKESGSR